MLPDKGIIMYEIIWSVRNDCYIIRKVMIYSTIVPEFMGFQHECIAYANAHGLRLTPTL